MDRNPEKYELLPGQEEPQPLYPMLNLLRQSPVRTSKPPAAPAEVAEVPGSPKRDKPSES